MNQLRGKRKFEMGRPPANTKLGHKRIHRVRTMGGNLKLRALRLDTGNFAWASEGVAHKSRIIDVVYNATNNEMVRTKTLTKNTIVQIDAAPFRQWYEAHYASPLGRKKTAEKKFTEEERAELPFLKKRSRKNQQKYNERQKDGFVDPSVEEQFVAGKLYACISSRPGKCGRSDGYILEGQELQFYSKKSPTAMPELTEYVDETPEEAEQRIAAYWEDQKTMTGKLVPCDKSLQDLLDFVIANQGRDPMIVPGICTKYDTPIGGGGGGCAIS